MTQAEFLARFVGILEEVEIPYMLVGSLASALHGAPRATQDVDIVVDPTATSLAALLARLPPDRYYVDADAARAALSARRPFNVVDLDSGWKADLIVRKDRAFSATEFARRVGARVHGVHTHVASAEDTVVSKLEWAAMAESERQLRDVAGVVAVQGESLDVEYVEHWARELGLTALWEQALRLARGE